MWAMAASGGKDEIGLLVIPKPGVTPNDLPTAPNKWNTCKEKVFDFFNVKDIYVVQHEYIFDPYQVFLDKVKDDQQSAQVSHLIRLLTHTPTAPRHQDSIYIHEKHAQTYKSVQKVLSFLDETEDFDRNYHEIGCWYHLNIRKYLQTEQAYDDSHEWHQFQAFLNILDPGHNRDEAYYENVFCKFCEFILHPSVMSVHVRRRSGRYNLDILGEPKNQRFRMNATPNLEITTNSLYNEHFNILYRPSPLLFVAVKPPIPLTNVSFDGKKLTPTPSPGPTPPNSKDNSHEYCPVGDAAENERNDNFKSAQAGESSKQVGCPAVDLDEKTEESEELFQDMQEVKDKYRMMTVQEEKAIASFISELLGELCVLHWYGKEVFASTDTPLYKNKSIRYGAGVIGYKVMFVAVCFVDQARKLQAKPKLDDMVRSRGLNLQLHTDIFITRQFHLLKKKDRICVAEILFALGAKRLSEAS